MKEAVILAGGYGTRLYPLTQTRAKSLLPLAGVPLMNRLVKYLESNGFEKIVITLNNFSNQIRESLSKLDCKAEVKFSEERTPLGTAGSVKNAGRHINDTFLVIQGDSLSDINLKSPMAFHIGQKATGTILLQERRDVTGLGVVDLDSENNIRGFIEKPVFSDGLSRLISTGIYILEPRFLDHIPKNQPYDFAKNLFPALLRKGLQLKGLPVSGYWIDIGTPKSYKEACRLFLKLISEHAPKYTDQLGHLFASDRLTDFRRSDQSDSFNSSTAQPFLLLACCSIDKHAIFVGCILESGVTVGKGAILHDSIILEGTKVDSGAVIESAVVGEQCRIGRGSALGRESVLGGYVEVMPTVSVRENAVVPARSIVGPDSTQWVYASDDTVVYSHKV